MKKKKNNEEPRSFRRAQGSFQQNNEKNVASQNVTYYDDSGQDPLT